ncbi:MAG: hypothetical protein JO218_15595 [Burkholderiales bacterium]|nr:hypothetical protein [Burkholderiales bacterium]
MKRFCYFLMLLGSISLMISMPSTFANDEKNRAIDSSPDKHPADGATSHELAGFNPVGLTEGMETELPELAFLIRSLNVASLGYVERSDIRKQKLRQGLMSPTEEERKNLVDLFLTGIGVITYLTLLERILRYFKKQWSKKKS